MVLQGFEVPSWFGWLTGVLFIKLPWGLPIFKSFCNFTTFVILAINIFTQVLWIDFFLHSRQLENEKFLRKILLQGFTIFGVIFNAFIRIFFCFQARNVCEFLSKLEDYPVSTVPTTLQKTRRLFSLLTWVSLCLRLGTGIFLAIQLSQIVPEDSWISSLGNIGYLGFMGLFGVLPIVSSFYVAFSFIVVTAVYLVWIFEDYGIQIEEAIKHAKKDPFQAVLQTRVLRQMLQEMKMDSSHFDLIQKFEDIRGLFRLFDEIVSPLLFCLIVMSVTSLVHAANSILIEGSSSASWAGLVSNWFNLAYQTVQLFLLQLGQDLYDRIAERKAKLNKMVSLMPVSISKLQLSDIVESLSIWKWEMTAWGFFRVNRGLMSAVFSTIMAYVVILFQLYME
ncbi:hypothetical protein Fcan01_02020 [Folsomia candida]|uniref:Gustatory receptor n=2 Tax=Folsomia candida TaxID=158441 RepID=A0A226EXH2_FOLCA|nr:hypothetical protein Fcan01_02020 [Folsomia candida]